jgi:hypothetical protein
MGEKRDLKILIFNRKNPPKENVLKEFSIYRDDFDLIIFPFPQKPNADECLIQAISFKIQLMHDFSEIINQHVHHEDEDDDFFWFDLCEIKMNTFYEMLGQRYKVSNYNLTEIECKIIH